ncbi:MAG TPA: Crp/Fnr family transcriptional regulator [Patescibacteria group bacterium]|nr:Crp/Fnr family transcriptional regulator [Patescibacteria group bacterium]
MLTEQEQLYEARLSEVKQEMAIPPMAKSARPPLRPQNRRVNPAVSSKKERSYTTLSDLGGVVTTIQKFPIRGIIYSQGDSAKTVMYVQKGRVELSVASNSHKDAVVAVLGPGNFFGEACLAGRAIRTKTATAMTRVVLQEIEIKELLRGLQADPSLAHRFLCYMVIRKTRIEENLIGQLTQSSEKRLARALLQLAGRGSQSKPQQFAGISQETLATMIGTTRSRVNFFMNKFRELGFIGYQGPLDRNGGIHIDASRLRKAYCI